jgi:6-phosphogluconate dehydrogenase
MRIGMVGLGRMGGNMAARLREHGHEVVGYDPAPGVGEAGSLEELVSALEPEQPRVVWVMVPAGNPTAETIAGLAGLLDGGDLVVDGGNSDFHDSLDHARLLARGGIRFVDAGVSGGVWGRTEGYCLMVGGDAADVAAIKPILRALATDGGCAHVGPVGAGHFAKMVHNGVEYALMQAYAEGYEILGASPFHLDVAAAMQVWRHGSVVRSWLLDLLAGAVAEDPDLHTVTGWADDSGEGRWTVREAVELAVPTPAIAAALFARFASRQDDSPSMRAVAVLRNQFGGHAVHPAGGQVGQPGTGRGSW